MSKYTNERRFSDLSSEEQSVLVQDVFSRYIEAGGNDGNNTSTSSSSMSAYSIFAHQLKKELHESVIVESGKGKQGIR